MTACRIEPALTAHLPALATVERTAAAIFPGGFLPAEMLDAATPRK